MKQTNRQTVIHTCPESDKQAGEEEEIFFIGITNQQTDKQTDKQTDTQTDTQTDI